MIGACEWVRAPTAKLETWETIPGGCISGAPSEGTNGGVPLPLEIGTALALKAKVTGGVPSPPPRLNLNPAGSCATGEMSGADRPPPASPPEAASQPAKPTWGGARNRSARTSDEISRDQAENIIAAARYSVALGLPLSHFVTIHWGQAGVPDCQAVKATGSYITLLRDAIRKNGGEFASVWVRENGDGKGSHVHILAHIPLDFPLAKMQRRWLRSITGRPYIAGTIKTKRIGGTLAAAQRVTEGYLANLGGVVAYVLKGASPTTGAALGLNKLEPGGRIIGKRCGTSENVGRAARKN